MKMAAPPAAQIAFTGSRHLFSAQRLGPEVTATLEDALVPMLTQRLRELQGLLGLAPAQACCGVSQLAIGADSVFTRALIALQWPQRIVLPQAFEAFLDDGDTDGPDFTPDERARARALLASPHIVELRVASNAPGRAERFEAANQAILDAGELVVCMRRTGARARAGGSADLIERARRAGKPVWQLEVALHAGQPRLGGWTAPSPAGRGLG